mmetsp:Transcript_23683/g.25919  ORF Transcript_23683/g.25919 Transcript_23683/m.25919 type:complete len:140 (-) Transcript_23683:106-525(-)
MALVRILLGQLESEMVIAFHLIKQYLIKLNIQMKASTSKVQIVQGKYNQMKSLQHRTSVTHGLISRLPLSNFLFRIINNEGKENYGLINPSFSDFGHRTVMSIIFLFRSHFSDLIPHSPPHHHHVLPCFKKYMFHSSYR